VDACTVAPANVPGALTVSASDLATKWAVTSASVSAGRGQQSKPDDLKMHLCTVQSYRGCRQTAPL
jgi:hypothetical protein